MAPYLSTRAEEALDSSVLAINSTESTSTTMPYTGGLNGVNLTDDNISSTTLLISLSVILLLVFAIRFTQWTNSELRLLASMSATSPQHQRFWTYDRNSWWPSVKRHLLYAPLRKKRHNREMQLSKAINVGTIPGRLHSILLMFYLLSNLAYCCWIDYRLANAAAIVAEIRGRTGHLAVVNMVALFLLAGRNNPLISLLRISFDTFNLFHRWIGRIIVLEALAHTVAWAINDHAARGWDGLFASLQHSSFLQYGAVGTIAMIVILFQSPSAIRHAFYETFLHLHQALALAALVGVCAHAKIGPLPQVPYLIVVVLLWSWDRLLRLARLVYRNMSLRSGLTRVTVTALPGEACRVTFALPRRWSPQPGSHVYAYLPAVSLWMSHPFSVAWTEEIQQHSSLEPLDEKLPTSSSSSLELPRPARTATAVSLIMSARSGMTRSLYNRARAAPHGKIHLRGALEGPYGGLESLHSYGTVLLFAGGVGITHQLAHVRDLLDSHARGTGSIRRLTLVWVVRTTEQLEWVRPWMDAVLAMPGRREILRVLLFVTKPRSKRDVVSASERVLMFAGRPGPAVLVRKEFAERVGAMCVGVCGPGALADDVRGAVREVVEEGKCDFWEEGFTW